MTVSTDEIHEELAGIRIEIANFASGFREELRYQRRCVTMALLASLALMAAILRLG